MDNVAKLIELAKQKFGELPKAEEKLLRAVGQGRVADYSSGAEEENDPRGAEKWGNERVVRAECLAWLCTDAEACKAVSHRGIEVRGARVEGKLDLRFGRVWFPLLFGRCAFSEEIDLGGSEMRALYFLGTHTGRIRADGIKVDGCIFLRDGFKAAGEVRLMGARVGGDLCCQGGSFINEGAPAISADGIKVEGNVFLRYGFKAVGGVRILGGVVGKDLSCIGGQFVNRGAYALIADGIEVGGSVFLSQGFEAAGGVRVVNAVVGGSLECDGAEFVNPGGSALDAYDVNIEGSIFLRDGTKIEGRVSFDGSVVGRYFVWTDLICSEGVTLELRSARIGILYDEEKSWPRNGKLLLHGLIYSMIDDEAPKDAESRTGWLRLQYGREGDGKFQPQPYEQLAKVLLESGCESDAKKVLIAKNKDRARFGSMGLLGRCWHCVLWLVMGYGYRPWQALLWILLFIVMGTIVFSVGNSRDLITPTKGMEYVSKSGVSDGGKEYKVSEDYPAFQSVIYSIDMFVPLVDLHQCKYWLPNLNNGKVVFELWGYSVLTGGVLVGYMWVHIVAGWILSTLFIVGLTGLVRR